MILTERQAVEHVFGSDAELVAFAVCRSLGLRYCRDAGAAAISDYALGLPDGLELERFSAAVDMLAWEAVTTLRGEEAA